MQNYLTGENCLPFELRIKYCDYKDSLFWYLIFIPIAGGCCYYVMNLFLVSLSLLALFVTQILRQLELIGYYVDRVDINDPKQLRRQLQDIGELHLDVLKAIKRLSELYIFNCKINECLLVLSTFFAFIGIIYSIPIICSLLVFTGIVIFIYAYAVQRVIDAEERIRERYYKLNWYEAKPTIRRQLFVAMFPIKAIKFAALTGEDELSLYRFSVIMQQAYEVGVFLLGTMLGHSGDVDLSFKKGRRA